ncbi:helix-turn-helix domain-containing protein [Qaidamihabitans albus]|uniref:helix-turn-helix domain-containing protein n=1 Tax=Qaidamihabitans albus TaxID=2795733 RepID=UPI0018F1860D|nr:helix-turn-helix transcriptional regulator [Qaidamihabitans albus]
MTVLLREAIGDRLRHARTNKSRTLRDISRAARVSLGYLSEVERGQKEASSELLASICDALELPLAELLRNVAADVSALDDVETAGVRETAEQPVAERAGDAAESSTAPRRGFEGGRLVSSAVGNGLAELRTPGNTRMTPTLRTTISAPKTKAVLAA